MGEEEAKRKPQIVEQKSGVEHVLEKPRTVLLSETTEEPQSGSSHEASNVLLNKTDTEPETGDSPEASPKKKKNRRSKKKPKVQTKEVSEASQP